MELTILQSKATSKHVVLVEQQYPYAKNSVYMPTALLVVGAQLIAAGHSVEVVDFNRVDINDAAVKEQFDEANIIGVSVIGAPYLPQTINLCKRLTVQYPNMKIIVGGQIISKLSPKQFARMFEWTNAIQISLSEDLEPLFGKVPSPYEVSIVPMYESMGGEINFYLNWEFPLFVSQGCAYNCAEFCSAARNQLEKHHNIENFREGVEFLVQRAKRLGIKNLGCYATSLDFFQNPGTVAEYLKTIAEIRVKYNFDFRIRALSCLKTFLRANEILPAFGELLKSAGFWRVGFGVDGSGEAEWKRQGKIQNHTPDIKNSLDLCQQLGLQAEVIMVTGYPTSSYKEIAKTVYNSLGYLLRWHNIKLRAYLAKMVLPGNNGWQRDWQTVESLLQNPQLFYNLEFNALGSPLTHPKLLNRWLSNISFLILTLGVAAFGRSISYPLLPQGQKGLYGKLAKWINRHMPIVD